MMLLRRMALAGAVAMLAAGCGLTADTRITASDGVAKHPYRKIAVVAMSASRAERKVFDDAFVARLSAAGVEGIVGDRYIEDAAVANGIEPVQAMRAPAPTASSTCGCVPTATTFASSRRPGAGDGSDRRRRGIHRRRRCRR